MDKKKNKREESMTRSKDRDKKQHKKPKYSPTMWGSSSSESEYESLYQLNQLCVGSLPTDATHEEVYEFFNGKAAVLKLGNQLNDQLEFVDRQALVAFGSRSETKEGLKLNGKQMRGKAIYVTRYGNSREIMCVSGFNNQVAVDVIRKDLRREFRKRGKLLNMFLPEDSTGSSLGFGYIFIDLADKVNKEEAYKDLIKDTEIGGVQVDIRRAKPKLCYRAEMEGKQQTVLKKGSDEDERKIALKKMLLPIPGNLHTSVETQKRFSWRKDKPDLIPEAPVQLSSDCWAIGLNRGHSASCKQSGIDGPVPTSEEIVKGVDAAFQVSGDGIRRLKHASSFMQNYCKEMIVHRRPRGADVGLFEDFERFLIDLSSKIPVMVTVECVPGFVSFNGQGIYRPDDIDCYLRTFEKFPVHCLFLTGNDVEDGVEFWELQESRGKYWGDDGCIKMERHKCLIKSVVEFKH